MQFTTFGRTGLRGSRLCLGTGTFGKQTDEAESFRVFDKAADAGVNFVDTADMYPGGAELSEVGRSEEITGRWLQGKRGRFILATKAGGPVKPNFAPVNLALSFCHWVATRCMASTHSILPA